jgi:CspA family cold shock protein
MTSRGRDRPNRRRGFEEEYVFEAPSASKAPPTWGRTDEVRQEKDAVVKWFNGEKGFGFVALSDGSGDAFIHINTLSQTGHSTVVPGQSMKVTIGQGQKGRQVSEVLSVGAVVDVPQSAPRGDGPPRDRPAFRGGDDRGPRPSFRSSGSGDFDRPRSSGPSTSTTGIVKWYNPTKGFGFIAPADGGKDIFIHASVLQRSGVMQLNEGQSVELEVGSGNKGPEALSVRVS